MQDRYVGDVGDFGKLSLIKSLAYDRDIGVAWYRTDGSSEKNSDGKHVNYLKPPSSANYRILDPELFDRLKVIVEAKDRSIRALEDSNFLPSARFHSAFVPAQNLMRRAWREEMCEHLDKCNFVFLDPDNGLERSRLSAKHVAMEDLRALRRYGRAILIYQHQLRVPASELAKWLYDRARSLGSSRVIVIRLRPYSSRLYSLIDYDEELAARADEFVQRWHPRAELLLRES